MGKELSDGEKNRKQNIKYIRDDLSARDTKLERANFFEISSLWLILARFG